MKPRLIPLYFEPGRDEGFDRQLASLQALLSDEVDFLRPLALGRPLPDAEAVVFPQLLGEAFRRLGDFQAIDRPILIITSEFGTLSMWDWEIVSYLRTEGVETIAPSTLAQTKKLCAALRALAELKDAKFLVFQDNPGEGAQASIFKRFYWWEDECSRRMRERFGVSVVRKSFRALAAQAEAVSNEEAEAVWRRHPLPIEGVEARPLAAAVKLYIALKRELDKDAGIRGIGINCLNESHFCDTTPCLAWAMLYESNRLIWGCEADTVSMLTQYLLDRSLGAPVMMSNVYPFLLGDAALKHERIERFPDVAEPDNHILVAHCGYVGLMPRSFAADWTLRRKVLGIVNENATAVDARLPTGPITLAKLGPAMDVMSVAEGELTGYVQYPGSDCRTGAVIRVSDGRSLVDSLVSHHYLFSLGHNLADIRLIGKVLGFGVEAIGA